MAAGRRAVLRGAAVVAPALLASAAVPAAGDPLPMRQPAPGLHVHMGVHEESTPANAGLIANIGFIVGRDAVAVIDTGGSAEAGRRLRAAVRAVTDRPIRYVINTHVHPDHVFGNAAFVADRPAFVGHRALPAALAQRAPHYREALRRTFGDAMAEASAAVPPTLLVEDSLDLDLGDRRLTLRAHATAHTDNDLTVFDHAGGTLWASDLLFAQRIPAVDGSVTGWLAVLDELAALPARRVVPGHGPVSEDWPGALADQRRYLTVLADEVRAVIRAGGTLERAVETVGRGEAGRWVLFDDYHRRNVTAAFVELEWE
ncbi:quinoprotein relay system zinc metallohydrolase 2 [Azospirillum halopraeferens]|uniref:quinoprotein relay system zinc metallohydrolase 2 n=1 Tax=Azospirillum halopraeferens TaxID=34010 RepID=UPI00040C182C|nr:quinoprotein relay system zinc metallohydrolase 2 [Azospirillum halopraeferens]